MRFILGFIGAEHVEGQPCRGGLAGHGMEQVGGRDALGQRRRRFESRHRDQRLAAAAEHVHAATDQAGQRCIRTLSEQQTLRDHLRIAVGETQCQRLGVERVRQVADHHVVGAGSEVQRALLAHYRVAFTDVAAVAGVQRGVVAAVEREFGGIRGMCRGCAGEGGDAGERKNGAMCCRHERVPSWGRTHIITTACVWRASSTSPRNAWWCAVVSRPGGQPPHGSSAATASPCRWRGSSTPSPRGRRNTGRRHRWRRRCGG